MKIHSQILLTIGLLLSSTFANAQGACVSGKPDHDNLVTQLRLAQTKSPITEIINQQYKLTSKPQSEAANCPTCENAQTTSRPDHLTDVANKIEGIPSAPQLVFKPECLVESNQFDASAGEVSCPNGTLSKSKDLCMTNEIMTYQNAAISSFLSCSKKLGFTTLSPSLLYSMYSLESGFKPQFASGSGLGMGQLTNIFIKDTQQAWRGRPLLEKIAQSDLKECKAAKIIAGKDLQNPPSRSNLCSFIQIGEGLERNILYTMVGIANSWEKDISPKLKDYMNRYASSPLLEEIKSLTLANAYGAGGRAAGRAIASRLSSLPPEKYLEQIKKPMQTVRGKKRKSRTLNIYTLKIAQRQEQIGKALPEPIKSAFAKEGAQACINQ